MSMADSSLLQQKIMFAKKDVDSGDYSPITKNHIAQGMLIKELCAAVLTYSDNTAYFKQNEKNAKTREDIIASATRILISEFARTDQTCKLG